MKKVILLIVAIAFIAIAAPAQNDAKKDNSKTQEATPLGNSWRANHAGEVYLMMKDHKMWLWKNNENKAMDMPITLENGTVVNSDGTWKTKEGKLGSLKNGECIDMKGNVAPIEAPKAKETTKPAEPKSK